MFLFCTGGQSPAGALSSAINSPDRQGSLFISSHFCSRSSCISEVECLISLSVFQLFVLLRDPALGSQVADGFGVLMSDSPDVLNRDCHADVRIMYRQRFFAENSTKLVQGFNSAEQGTSITTSCLNRWCDCLLCI